MLYQFVGVPRQERVTALDAEEGGQSLIESDVDFDPESAGARGMHYERLDQLALEHVLGAR